MELAFGPAAWTRRTRVVVVGTGAAGLSAMLHLIAAGVVERRIEQVQLW